MPDREEILNGLRGIVDKHKFTAIIWHAFLYILSGALLSGWVPSGKIIALAMVLPLFSVGVLAWLGGNPFNGSIFSVISVLLVVYGLGNDTNPVVLSSEPYLAAGVIMIIFGLVYPHFLKPGPYYRYLFASPVGLIPCPTLSVVTGFLLLYNGFGSKAISLIVIIPGLFYGLFGVFKLKVYLDIILLAGALTLLVGYLLW